MCRVCLCIQRQKFFARAVIEFTHRRPDRHSSTNRFTKALSKMEATGIADAQPAIGIRMQPAGPQSGTFSADLAMGALAIRAAFRV